MQNHTLIKRRKRSVPLNQGAFSGFLLSNASERKSERTLLEIQSTGLRVKES